MLNEIFLSIYLNLKTNHFYIKSAQNIVQALMISSEITLESFVTLMSYIIGDLIRILKEK